MRKREFAFIVFVVFVTGTAFARGFLTAQSFPKTFQDLSFTDRMAVLQEGYEIYETQYDNNGVCISGCAYPGITIADDMRAVDAATAEMQTLIEQADNVDPQPIMPGYSGVTGGQIIAQDWCRNGKSTKLPLRPPVDISTYRISSDFGFRTSSPNGASFHPALDISTPTGTPVYATADGVVSVVSRQDSNGGAGLYINIEHENGFVSQYLHLDKAFVKVGQHVSACEQIALSGGSGTSKEGKAYSPHLDYRVRLNKASNSFVDLLCPCRASDRGSGNNVGAPNAVSTCEHSIFYDDYRFSSQANKRIQWRKEHDHCLPNTNPNKNINQLPDEIM